MATKKSTLLFALALTVLPFQAHANYMEVTFSGTWTAAIGSAHAGDSFYGYADWGQAADGFYTIPLSWYFSPMPDYPLDPHSDPRWVIGGAYEASAHDRDCGGNYSYGPTLHYRLELRPTWMEFTCYGWGGGKIASVENYSYHTAEISPTPEPKTVWLLSFVGVLSLGVKLKRRRSCTH